MSFLEDPISLLTGTISAKGLPRLRLCEHTLKLHLDLLVCETENRNVFNSQGNGD